MDSWYVYMVRCADNTFYTGITRDPVRRIHEHNTSDLAGAAYTRSRRPVHLVYEEVCMTRAEALRREYAIKRMNRKNKESLLK